MADDEALKVKPYEPFPSFQEWTAKSVSLETFNEYAAVLENLRANADPLELANAIELATRWAAIDTGAIEGLYDVERGFTISMAVSGAVLDSIHALKGAEVARAVSDALAAYDFVLDVATSSRPITEVWIRQLHEIICKSQEEYLVATSVGPQNHRLELGKYKSMPNSPYNFDSKEVHSYAPVVDTPSEMARLVEEFRTDLFLESSPVLQAAYAHYAFVCVHPFADGNGRVSRALASIFLYRSPGLPLVVFADQKDVYISALELADAGDYSQFIRFVADRVVDSVGMVRSALAGSVSPKIRDQVAGFETMLTGRGGLEHKELDSIALRLAEGFETAAKKVIADEFNEGKITASVGRDIGRSLNAPAGYRIVPGNPITVVLGVRTASPAEATVQRRVSVVVAKPGVDAPDFLLLKDSAVLVEAFLREMNPSVSGAVQFRLRAVAEGQFREMLSKVTEAALEVLRTKGYAT